MQVNYLKIMLLGILLSVGVTLNADIQSHITKELRWKLCQETSDFYKLYNGRSWHDYRPFMFSAYNVSKMFPVYPAVDDTDRMIQFFEFGGLESGWQLNFIVLNVPGAKYSNGKVKRVSLDISWVGLNEDTVAWTYWVAKAMQDGKPIPRRVGNWYATKEFIELMKHCKIPKNLKLRKIDLKIAKEAKLEYYRLRKTIKDPNELRKVVNKNLPAFEENEQDDLDSALVYRVIEEMDRMTRGWTYGSDLYAGTKRGLYRRLKRSLEE